MKKVSVDSFMVDLAHPLKPEVASVRQWILGVDASIGEEVKWNAPSFRTADFFATFHLRSHDAVQLVFHRGAKKKDAKKLEIADPAGLIKWLSPDRCLITLGAGAALEKNRAAFEAIVRDWIRQI